MNRVRFIVMASVIVAGIYPRAVCAQQPKEGTASLVVPGSQVRLGYRGLKIGVGSEVLPSAHSTAHLEEKCQRLLAALEAVGTDISIDADANHVVAGDLGNAVEE